MSRNMCISRKDSLEILEILEILEFLIGKTRIPSFSIVRVHNQGTHNQKYLYFI